MEAWRENIAIVTIASANMDLEKMDMEERVAKGTGNKQ